MSTTEGFHCSLNHRSAPLFQGAIFHFPHAGWAALQPVTGECCKNRVGELSVWTRAKFNILTTKGSWAWISDREWEITDPRMQGTDSDLWGQMIMTVHQLHTAFARGLVWPRNCYICMYVRLYIADGAVCTGGALFNATKVWDSQKFSRS